MTQRWFDRKFTPLNKQLSYSGTLMRLRDTPLRLRHLVMTVPMEILTHSTDSTWSIQENVGHLLDLEPLWLGRVRDFKMQVETLRPADLSNQKTHDAGHNAESLPVLLENFERQRSALVSGFESLSEQELANTALHPRLKTPMLPVDLAYFVAEHDDHHLARIFAILHRT